MKAKMIIRQEIPDDHNKVYELVKKSFATTSFSDGTEPDYLNNLRNTKMFIPELSLVALSSEETIIGQIVLTETIISCTNSKIKELLLSPLCVHPDHFGKGIATQLMKKAFKIAREKGYTAVFLCGDPILYSKFGFKPTYKSNIFHVKDKERKADWCMVKELQDGALKLISGTVDIE